MVGGLWAHGNTVVNTSDSGTVTVRKVDDSYAITKMRSPRPYEGIISPEQLALLQPNALVCEHLEQSTNKYRWNVAYSAVWD